MRIFVTGGTGRIGRVLVKKLLAKGHSLVLLCRSKEKAFELFGKKARVLEGDLVSESEDGQKFSMTKGMSYEVSDGMSSHRSYSKNGAKLLVIDGTFLAEAESTS